MASLENDRLRHAVAVPQGDGDIRRDPAPTFPAAVPRHLFTMTVDQASAELFSHGFGRDDRTIQRWCKAGKLHAIIDEMHSDRYLIDPSSLKQVVAVLVENRDTRSTGHVLSSRPLDFAAAASRPHFDHVGTQQESSQGYPVATRSDEASAMPRHDASQDHEVAALRQQIEDLEKEKMLLTVDKQVREQMVDYLKEQFGKMIDQALEGRQDVGQLRADNAQLRAQLPLPLPTPDGGQSVPHRFTPQQVRQHLDPVHTDVSWGASQGV